MRANLSQSNTDCLTGLFLSRLYFCLWLCPAHVSCIYARFGHRIDLIKVPRILLFGCPGHHRHYTRTTSIVFDYYNSYVITLLHSSILDFYTLNLHAICLSDTAFGALHVFHDEPTTTSSDYRPSTTNHVQQPNYAQAAGIPRMPNRGAPLAHISRCANVLLIYLRQKR